MIIVGNNSGFAAVLWVIVAGLVMALALPKYPWAIAVAGPGLAVVVDFVLRIRSPIGNLAQRLFLPNLGASVFFLPIWFLFPLVTLPSFVKMRLEEYWWAYLAGLLTWALVSWFLEQRLTQELEAQKQRLLQELMALQSQDSPRGSDSQTGRD